MRETGYMGEQAFYRTSKLLLDWINVLEIARDCWRWMEIAGGTQINPIHGGIDFGWGAPCPQPRD